MAIAFRDASATENATGATVASGTIPATAQVGDLAIMVITSSQNDAAPTISGWTQVGVTTTASSMASHVFSRILQSGDPGAATTATLATAAKRLVHILVYSGVDSTTPIEAQAVVARLTAAATANHVTPTVGVTTTGAVVVEIASDKGPAASTDIAAPAGFTRRLFTATSGTGAPAAAVGDSVATYAAGATAGGETWVSSQVVQGIDRTLVLRPSSVVPEPEPDPNTLTFDDGVDGADIATGGLITTVAAGITYSAAAAIHGGLGITSSVNTANLTVTKPAGFVDPSNAHSGSIYIRPRAVGSTAVRLVMLRDSHKSYLGGIRVHSDGKFDVAIDNTRAVATQLSWTANRTYRLDWTYSGDTDHVLTLKVFTSREGTVPAETISAPIELSDFTSWYISPSGATAAGNQVDIDTVRFYDGIVTPAPYGQAPPGTYYHAWLGAPTGDGFTVASKVTDASSVRLILSTSPDMTAPFYSSPAIPDSDGYAKNVVAGLAPGTTYYYQVAATSSAGTEDAVGTVGRARTLPAGNSFRFALSACITDNAADSSALNDLRNWDPDFNVFTGDFHYQGTTATTRAGQRGAYETQVQNTAGLKSMIRDVPMFYCTSDHEAGPDNGDSNNTYTQANIDAYKQIVPHASLADTRPTTVGRYQAWVVGRVRFIMLDIRNTDRTPGLTADGAAKTMLGAVQKAWLKDQLLTPEPVKVIVSDVAWLGAASTTNGEDKWWSYATERQEIADFIAANAVRVLLLHGDSHALGVATPEANPWGRFPVYCSAPLHNTGGGRNLSDFSAYWNNSGGDARVYARITVTDTGDAITFTYSGWDASAGVERVTQVDVFPLRNTWYLWNGAEEVPLPDPTGVWDGSAPTPVTFSLFT